MIDSTGRFVAVDINQFRNATRDINFDVYLRLSEDNYAHVFSRTTGIDYKRLAHYILKGVHELFILKEDEERFQAFVAVSAEQVFHSPDTPPEKKIATLLNMTEQNMAEIFSQFTISEQTAKSTEKLVRNYVQLMTENPHSLATILRLVSHGEYLYYHSIAVSIFSLVLGRAVGSLDSRMLEILGMGGLLHDIGSSHVKPERPGARIDVTDEESEEMREHPKLGLQALEGNPAVPDEVRYIVYQHHEQPSGKGFPNGLRGSVIFFPAKIVAVTDSFAGLISKRPGHVPMTPERAIAVMANNPGKWDRELVKLLGDTLHLSGSLKKAA